MAFSTPRLPARLWPRARFDVRLPLALLGLAVGVLAVLAYVERGAVTTPVVVAARGIPAGHVIERDDLTVIDARLDGPLGAMAFGQAELETVVGQTAGQAIHAGALVVAPDLGHGRLLAADEVAVTVAVAADTVFAGLRRGDQVAVLETVDGGPLGSATTLLLEQATVYQVARDSGRVTLGGDAGDDFDDSGRITNVTLVVPRAETERVTHALVTGRLTLVLAPTAAEAPTP